MRHQVRGRKLGRTASHRKATLRALSTALIKHQRIVTTVAKAKELRRYVEPIITKAVQEDSPHHRRQAFAMLSDKQAVTILYDDVVPAVGDRPGGYTRVIKIGTRAGDGAPTAMIELVDFNDVKPEGKDTKKKKTRRAGRKKATDTAGEKTAESDSKPAKAKPAKAKSVKADDTEAKNAKAPKAETSEAAEVDEPKSETSSEDDKPKQDKE